MTFPVYQVNQRQAEQAYEVHCALLKAERDQPALKNNPQWTIIRQDAFVQFSEAFEVRK